MNKFLLILLFALPVTACKSTAQPVEQTSGPIPGESAALTVAGNNAFAFDIYRTLTASENQKGQNLFLSPFSLSSALAMTYAGARSETELQMAKVMHFSVPSTELHRSFASLTKSMQDRKGYQLSVANALWPHKAFPFLKEFMQIGTEMYQAGLQPLDYVDHEVARKIINQWVEGKTQNKIQNLIPTGVLNPLTRLVLTNAIYFKGDWAVPFIPADTRTLPFRLSDGQTVQAPMMVREGEVSFMENEDLKLLELPYSGRELSMLVLLPSVASGLEKVESMLTPGNIQTWISTLASEKVKIYLPKFKMTCSYALAPVLVKMGMPDAFDENKADFSAMTGNKDLFVSAVLHKAFVEVNEVGTEAAAATAVVMELKSMSMSPQFRADRPFIFMIRDKKTGSILFLGRVMNPLKAGE